MTRPTPTIIDDPSQLLAGASSVLVIVAHPDDETLWAGGVLLAARPIRLTVCSMCRADDTDRAPKFARACARLGASASRMADLDDGPEQAPLPDDAVQAVLRSLLHPPEAGLTEGFDIVMTHNPAGEYTRHRRHEETSRAVISLWREGEIDSETLLLFSYDDAGRSRLPTPRPDADILVRLPAALHERKRSIIIETYGFAVDSWEARATPTVEAFQRLRREARGGIGMRRAAAGYEAGGDENKGAAS